jgi:hypothetical protein
MRVWRPCLVRMPIACPVDETLLPEWHLTHYYHNILLPLSTSSKAARGCVTNVCCADIMPLLNWRTQLCSCTRYFWCGGNSFIHLVVCLTTGQKPPPKRALHIVWSRAFSFKWEYSLLSLRSSNSFLRLLPCLPLTSFPPCIFPSITPCRRQFLRKMWPIQFAFRLRISCRILRRKYLI